MILAKHVIKYIVTYKILRFTTWVKVKINVDLISNPQNDFLFASLKKKKHFRISMSHEVNKCWPMIKMADMFTRS